MGARQHETSTILVMYARSCDNRLGLHALICKMSSDQSIRAAEF